MKAFGTFFIWTPTGLERECSLPNNSRALLCKCGARPKPRKEKSKLRKSLTLEFARKKQWVRKEKVPGLSVSERTNPTLYAEGTR